MHPMDLRVGAAQVGSGRCPRTSGRCGFGTYIAVCMIPGSVLCLPASYAGLRESGSSRPYLTVIGPPELRFREAIIPQPDLSTRPAAGAPPHPVTEESQPSPGANRPENRAPAAEVRLSAQPASAPAQAKAGTPDEPSPAGAPPGTN